MGKPAQLDGGMVKPQGKHKPPGSRVPQGCVWWVTQGLESRRKGFGGPAGSRFGRFLLLPRACRHLPLALLVPWHMFHARFPQKLLPLPPALFPLCRGTLSLWGYTASVRWKSWAGDVPQGRGEVALGTSLRSWACGFCCPYRAKSLLGVSWPTPALAAHTKQVFSCPPAVCKEEERFYLLFLWLLNQIKNNFFPPIHTLTKPTATPTLPSW